LAFVLAWGAILYNLEGYLSAVPKFGL
jgi:hypothetical protein